MYKVYFDGVAVHDPSLGDQMKILMDGKVKKAVNCADSFTFTIYPNNVGYASLNLMTTSVTVMKDNTVIFHGRPLSEETGWENQKSVICEGDLALFNDTVMRPYEYTGTVANYINLLVNAHNAQTDQSKQITVRTVTVTDPNNSISRSNSNYVRIMEELQNKTVGTLGGYLRTEYDDGTIYLDYLADSTDGTNQTLEIGKNILDFQRSLAAEALATAIIPLGATDENGQRLTIKSVNNNQDYIVDANAVSESGTIYTVVTWDNVTVASNLLSKAQAKLADLKRKVPRIQLSAVDLTNAGVSADAIGFFEYVTVVDAAHNVSGQYLISEREWNLSAPENDTVTFGSEEKTISGATASNTAAFGNFTEVIINTAQAIVDAQTALIRGGVDGHMVIGTTADGASNELFFLDTDSVLTARSVLRINRNGIGFSTTGIEGPYTTAWTIDGDFNAARITTGILQDAQGNFSLNLVTGEIEIHNSNLNDDVADLYSNVSLTSEQLAVTITRIDNIHTGWRNLLRASDTAYSNTSSPTAEYYLTDAPAEGEEVTLQIKGNFGEGADAFLVVNSGDTNPSTEIDLIELTSESYDETTGIYKATFNWTLTDGVDIADNQLIRIYSVEADPTRTAQIEWVKLERGNQASDWTPAPEDQAEAIEDAQVAAEGAQASANEALTTTQKVEATMQFTTEGLKISGTEASRDNSYVNIAADKQTFVVDEVEVMELGADGIKTQGDIEAEGTVKGGAFDTGRWKITENSSGVWSLNYHT